MRIAVCDGSSYFRDAFRKEIFDYDSQIQVHSFAAYEELLGYKDIAALDCVFLATELNSVSGMATAVELRQVNKNAEVFFVTENCEKYAQQIFYHSDVIRPFALLVKPVSRSFMRHMLDILKQYLNERSSVRLSIRLIDGNVTTVLAEDIVFVEHSNRVSYIHTRNLCLQSRVVIPFFDERLPKHQFIHASKSVIVNAKSVASVSKDRIILLNGTKLFPSRNYRKAFVSGFLAFSEKSIPKTRENATL